MSGAETAPILDQAFSRDSLYALRAALSAHASQAAMPPGRIEDLVVAVHELAANAVRHGAGHGRVRVWTNQHALHCEVSDDGVAPWAHGAGWRIRPGHGLWLVRQLADQTNVRSVPGGTTVTVRFTLGPPEGLEPFHLAEYLERGCTVLAVTGHLSLNAVGQFIGAVDDLLARTPAPRLVLDLADLTFCDSAGLAALITAIQRATARPRASLILAGVPGRLIERLKGTAMATRFSFADTATAAIDRIGGP